MVAVDADTGSVIAATLGGWSCNAANQKLQFDGSYEIQRLPLNHNYKIYAEPLEGLVTPANLSDPIHKPLRPAIGAFLHRARCKHKFQLPHPPRVTLIQPGDTMPPK